MLLHRESYVLLRRGDMDDLQTQRRFALSDEAGLPIKRYLANPTAADTLCRSRRTSASEISCQVKVRVGINRSTLICDEREICD